jgi:hypothetical protein
MLIYCVVDSPTLLEYKGANVLYDFKKNIPLEMPDELAEKKIRAFPNLYIKAQEVKAKEPAKQPVKEIVKELAKEPIKELEKVKEAIKEVPKVDDSKLREQIAIAKRDVNSLEKKIDKRNPNELIKLQNAKNKVTELEKQLQ